MPRTYIVTGLKIPFMGKAPTAGRELAKMFADKYPSANVKHLSWLDDVNVEELKREGPITLIGHSFGGSHCVKIARQMEKAGIPVERMLLLDPVPTDFHGRWKESKIDIPGNVKQCTCIARMLRLYPRSKKAKGNNVDNGTKWLGHDLFFSKDDLIKVVEEFVRAAAGR